MINIIVNNKEMTVKKGTKVRELLTELGNERAAVWINGTQLLKKEYETRILNNDDVVKVLRLVAGG